MTMREIYKEENSSEKTKIFLLQITEMPLAKDGNAYIECKIFKENMLEATKNMLAKN